MQRWREPDAGGQVAVAAGAFPDLRLDFTEGKRDRFHADATEARMVDAAGGRDVELRLLLLGRREVELPEHGQRVEGRQFQRGGLVVVEQHDTGLPVEGRGFVAAVAGALGRVEIRLQAAARDPPAARKPSLPAEEKRGQTARLAGPRDAVLIVGVLEPVDRVPDEEALGAEKATVGE